MTNKNKSDKRKENGSTQIKRDSVFAKSVGNITRCRRELRNTVTEGAWVVM